jgi:hypothetical protein
VPVSPNVADDFSTAHIVTCGLDGDYGFVDPRARPHVMTMVANMEQGQPKPRHIGEDDMSIVQEQILDEIEQIPDNAQRFQIFDRDDTVRDDVSEASERSRTRSLTYHNAEKDLLIASLKVKRAQRKVEERQIKLDILRIDVRAQRKFENAAGKLSQSVQYI